MKIMLAVFLGLCVGLGSALLSSAVSAALLWLCVPPFLRIIDIPALTERFCNLGYAGYFVCAFAIRLLIGLVTPVDTGADKKVK
jgi:hypothetical protein